MLNKVMERTSQNDMSPVLILMNSRSMSTLLLKILTQPEHHVPIFEPSLNACRFGPQKDPVRLDPITMHDETYRKAYERLAETVNENMKIGKRSIIKESVRRTLIDKDAYFDFLKKFPDIKIVYLIRRPEETFFSYCHQFLKQYPSQTNTFDGRLNYNDIMKNFELRCGKVVLSEDLINNTEETVKDLFDYFGTEFMPEYLKWNPEETKFEEMKGLDGWYETFNSSSEVIKDERKVWLESKEKILELVPKFYEYVKEAEEIYNIFKSNK